jgi:nitrate/nitrite transporter NarK
VLAASGLVAGEGLAGVAVAALVATGVAAKSMTPRIPGAAGEVVGLAVVAAVCFFLYRASRAR